MSNKPIDSIPKNQWDAIIYSIVKPFLPLCAMDNTITAEDLKQEAWIGLMHASQRYNPDLNTKFTTFAYIYIRGYVMRYISNASKVQSQTYTASLDDRVAFDTDAESNDMLEAITRLLSDQKHADILIEHFVNNKSTRRLGKELGVSATLIANRINRLLDLLETRLKYENA